MSMTNPLSAELEQMSEMFVANFDEQGCLLLDNDLVKILNKRLILITENVKALEDELAVHRIQKSSAAEAAILDDLALGFLEDAVSDNVVVADFSAKNASPKKGGLA